MKRIHFEELHSLKNNWLLFLAIFLVTIGYLLIDKDNNLISTIGYIVLCLHFGKIFFFRNHVRWNQDRIMIRMGSLFYQSFRYKDIQSDVLKVMDQQERTTSFHLQGIHRADVDRLQHLLNTTNES